MSQTTQTLVEPMAPAATEGGLIHDVLERTRIKPSDVDAWSLAEKGTRELLRRLLEDPGHQSVRVDKSYVDSLIAEIDRSLSAQLDEVLHHPSVQELEAAWRGLRFLVDRTDFRENVRVEMLPVTKGDLADDFRDAGDVTRSAWYRTVYTSSYGTFGGKPYAAIIGNFAFGPNAQDVGLLQNLASVSAMAHAPFIAAAGPELFGTDSYAELARLPDLETALDGPQYVKWRSFRESPDSRYVGLTMPRFLLRLPYDRDQNPVRAFDYHESVGDSHQKYLWGNAAFAFATRLTESFAKYRWCPNIVGPQAGGAVEDLPVHLYEAMGGREAKIPTEVLISERREVELAEQGFIALTMRRDSDNACFFSANSCQKPRQFPDTEDGKTMEASYRLGTQLPYLFIICRLAHYVKVVQREQIGTHKDRSTLERELNEWLRQYVNDMDAPPRDTLARRPLRRAKISVEEVPGNAGWYRVDMQVMPQVKFGGAFFTLSLVGKLDKE